MDLAAIVLQQHKNKPNTLLVDEASMDDDAVISVHPDKLAELDLLPGDQVLVKGKKRKTTVAVITPDENADQGKLRMSKIVRSNIR